MTVQTNHTLSVDCVVFGFDGERLKVLLVERRYIPKLQETLSEEREYKLPGSMIFDAEEMPAAANRVLAEMTGLRNIYLKQTHIFSDPNRVSGDDLKWINEYHGVNATRVVTVGYYVLVKLNNQMLSFTKSQGAIWRDVDQVKHLAMDHKEILADALTMLCEQVVNSPVIFELLPRKFTIRQLQNLYSTILGIEIDNRNFRKKILGSNYLIPTGEKERGVAHKPAEYFTFNKAKYKKLNKSKFKLGFI